MNTNILYEEKFDYLNFDVNNEYQIKRNYMKTFQELFEEEFWKDKLNTSIEEDKKGTNENINDNIFQNNDISLKKNNSFLNLVEDENRYFIHKSTEDKLIINKISENKKPKKMFIKKKMKTQKMKKENVSKGRLKKNTNPSYKVKHNKFEELNVIQRIKTTFINNLLNFINKKHKEYSIRNNKKVKPLLYKINNNLYIANSKEKNQEFFSLKVSELFSSDLTRRYSKFLRKNPDDYNKRQINLLIKENKEKEIIELLNLTLEEIYEKFISNEISEFNLKSCLIILAKKEEKEYVDLFKDKAENLIRITYSKGKIRFE